MRLLMFALVGVISVSYSFSATEKVSFCNGMRDKNAEFHIRYLKELPQVTARDWTIEGLQNISHRLKQFENGRYRSLPPVNIIALYTQIDRKIMWATFHQFKENQSLGRHAHGEDFDRILAMSQVILLRLENSDQCV